MSDQDRAALIAFALVVALRALDYFLPKGWMSKWTRDRSTPVDDHDDGDGDT